MRKRESQLRFSENERKRQAEQETKKQEEEDEDEVFSLRSGAIYWCSKRQPTVSFSTTLYWRSLVITLIPGGGFCHFPSHFHYYTWRRLPVFQLTFSYITGTLTIFPSYFSCFPWWHFTHLTLVELMIYVIFFPPRGKGSNRSSKFNKLRQRVEITFD